MAGGEMVKLSDGELAAADAVFILDTADEKRIGEGADGGDCERLLSGW